MPLLPREQAEQILALRERGMTVRAIARQVGCAQNTVTGYIHGRTTPGQRASQQNALNDFVDYCRQRLTDDPELSPSTLFHELAALGYTGSRPTYYRDLGRHDLLRLFVITLDLHGPLPNENTQLRETRHPVTTSAATAARSLRPLPVRVSPLAGEPLASYIGRVAAGNHLSVNDMLTVLPEWISRRVVNHDDRGRRHNQTSAAEEAVRQLARLTGVTEVALTHAVPAFATVLPGTRPMGPMRIITACRRCTAAHGIPHPVRVHLPGYVQVCVRHGIWLSRSDNPQLDISCCPEIITAQKHAWRLLRHLTPEQLMFARVTGADIVHLGPASDWRRRRHRLELANPGLDETTADQELTNVAVYPDAIASADHAVTPVRARSTDSRRG